MTIIEAIKHARDKAEESREYIVDDCNLEPFEAHCNSQCIKCAEEHEQLAQWLEELKEYKELEEQGLLLKLPCKVGDTVYEIVNDEIISFSFKEQWRIARYLEAGIFGKIAFLTKEEAEKALKVLRKWNYDIHEYEPYSVPDEWDCRYNCNDLSEIINCCQCGKEIIFGYSYSSQEVHSLMGFGYMVCEECHEVEMKRLKDWKVQNERSKSIN
jgi:hypothetical protein